MSGPSPEGVSVIAFAISFVAIAGLVVLLRFYTRGVILHVLGIEDWFIAAALVRLGQTEAVSSFPC